MTEVSADDSRGPHQLVAVRLRDNPESLVAEWLDLFSCCRVETCWLRPVSLEWNFRSVSSNLR